MTNRLKLLLAIFAVLLLVVLFEPFNMIENQRHEQFSRNVNRARDIALRVETFANANPGELPESIDELAIIGVLDIHDSRFLAEHDARYYSTAKSEINGSPVRFELFIANRRVLCLRDGSVWRFLSKREEYEQVPLSRFLVTQREQIDLSLSYKKRKQEHTTTP